MKQSLDRTRSMVKKTCISYIVNYIFEIKTCLTTCFVLYQISDLFDNISKHKQTILIRDYFLCYSALCIIQERAI